MNFQGITGLIVVIASAIAALFLIIFGATTKQQELITIGVGLFSPVSSIITYYFAKNTDEAKLAKRLTKKASFNIRGFIGQIYLGILWLAGEPLTNTELDEIRDGGDRWTYHMRRTKKRLGNTLWWVSVIATIVLYTIWFLKLINDKPKVWWKDNTRLPIIRFPILADSPCSRILVKE